MIRRLIILLLIAGCVFGDTIVVKKERKYDDGEVKVFNSETMGEYVGILNAKAYLRTPDGNLKEFNCSDVIVIFDNERKPIEYDCSKNTFVPKTLNELDINAQTYPIVGGTLIAIGGAVLFSNIDKECDDCIIGESEYREFIKDSESTQKIGYGFIILGGILVAFGI